MERRVKCLFWLHSAITHTFMVTDYLRPIKIVQRGLLESVSWHVRSHTVVVVVVVFVCFLLCLFVCLFVFCLFVCLFFLFFVCVFFVFFFLNTTNLFFFKYRQTLTYLLTVSVFHSKNMYCPRKIFKFQLE